MSRLDRPSDRRADRCCRSRPARDAAARRAAASELKRAISLVSTLAIALAVALVLLRLAGDARARRHPRLSARQLAGAVRHRAGRSTGCRR